MCFSLIPHELHWLNAKHTWLWGSSTLLSSIMRDIWRLLPSKESGSVLILQFLLAQGRGIQGNSAWEWQNNREGAKGHAESVLPERICSLGISIAPVHRKVRMSSPSTLQLLATRSLLQDEALAIAALKNLPKELFPLLFKGAFDGQQRNILRAMVEAWPFRCLPVWALMKTPDLRPWRLCLMALICWLSRRLDLGKWEHDRMEGKSGWSEVTTEFRTWSKQSQSFLREVNQWERTVVCGQHC